MQLAVLGWAVVVVHLESPSHLLPVCLESPDHCPPGALQAGRFQHTPAHSQHSPLCTDSRLCSDSNLVLVSHYSYFTEEYTWWEEHYWKGKNWLKILCPPYSWKFSIYQSIQYFSVWPLWSALCYWKYKRSIDLEPCPQVSHGAVALNLVDHHKHHLQKIWFSRSWIGPRYFSKPLEEFW